MWKIVSFVTSRFSSWQLIAMAVTGALVVGFGGGYKFASTLCDNSRLAAFEDAVERKAEVEDTNRDVETIYVKEKAEVEVRYRTITKEIIKYVQNPEIVDRECLTDDGVRLWNLANQGATEGATLVPR